MSDIYTFWSLLEDYVVRIPLIQRDYAQGRSDDSARAVRQRFLQSLYQTLTADPASRQPLDLDFVYGEQEPHLPLPYFVPLDGQQRLTTLYLLHWYLAATEGRLQEAQPYLSRFTYETRSSSREFCEQLSSCPDGAIRLKMGRKVGTQLRNMAWFQPAWRRDPTVEGMLVMLDDLAAKFGPQPGLFDQLVSVTNPPVYFRFLELKKVGLTDDLYLKMNARGKALTPFENWKAEFDQFLLRQPDAAYRAEFTLQVDNAWTDLFWKHRASQLDVAFTRFLQRMTVLLSSLRTNTYETEEQSLENNPDPFALYQQVYANSDNVRFLFDALNLLSQLQDQDTEVFFKSIFAVTATPGRVVLFGETPDLFEQICGKNRPDIKVRVLLLVLLQYGTKAGGLRADDADLQDLMRVVRNLLERERQQNDTRYSSDRRERWLGWYLTDAFSLVQHEDGRVRNVYELLATTPPTKWKGFRDQAVAEEVEKANLIQHNPAIKAVLHELEDLPVFRGTLHNLALTENEQLLPAFLQSVRAIWHDTAEPSLIIRAWLSIGEYGVDGGTSRLGNKYFLGNTANWHTILGNSSTPEVRETLPLFLRAYAASPGSNTTEKLTALIADWLTTHTIQTDGWRYYFVKYPQLTQDSRAYYAWTSDYELRLLDGNNLHSYHINPYCRVVAQLIGDAAICNESSAWTTGAYKTALTINVPVAEATMVPVRLSCRDRGWLVELPADYQFSPDQITRYELIAASQNSYWLNGELATDRIETAVQFVRDMHKTGLLAALPVVVADDMDAIEVASSHDY